MNTHYTLALFFDFDISPVDIRVLLSTVYGCKFRQNVCNCEVCKIVLLRHRHRLEWRRDRACEGMGYDELQTNTSPLHNDAVR